MCKDILPDDLPQSVSISAADINITVRAVSAGVLRCNLAKSNSVLKVCISKHCHELTGFLLWIATRCIGCIVEVVVKSKGFISLVGYNDGCLAAITHVKSIIRVVRPSRNVRSHSVLSKLVYVACILHVPRMVIKRVQEK